MHLDRRCVYLIGPLTDKLTPYRIPTLNKSLLLDWVEPLAKRRENNEKLFPLDCPPTTLKF